MTHKNWDNVRDYRIYGYLNQSEKDIFDKAVAITGLQRATAVRQFVIAAAKKLLADDSRPRQAVAGANYQFYHANITV